MVGNSRPGSMETVLRMGGALSPSAALAHALMGLNVACGDS
jgi:hypothetical protein